MKNIPDYTQTHSAILKNPIARILELFSEMLQGRIKLSINGRKYIFYMYLLLSGSCTREMVPLLLGMADRAINNAKPHTPQKNLITSKTVDDFLSLRLRHGSISKTVLKSRILYQLTADGYRELATFLSALPTASGCDASFIKWCMSDANRLVENHSVHSANVGLILTHIAARRCLSVTEFALNTPLDSHGSIHRNGFDQSTNRFRSDAYLFINSPCRLEIFFENDMGTERMEAIAAKMERYFALIFSAERELRTSSVHFSIGDYHKNDNVSHYDSRIITPSKYTLQVYRACTSTFISAAQGLYGSCPHDPGDIIKLMHKVCTAPDITRNNIMDETVNYLKQIYGLCPAPPDILSYFEHSLISKISTVSENAQNSIYRIRPDKAYLKRREKIFEWCRSAPDISMLIKRGFRITASDNCCDGTDFIYSYPHLYPEGMENYLTLIENIFQAIPTVASSQTCPLPQPYSTAAWDLTIYPSFP